MHTESPAGPPAPLPANGNGTGGPPTPPTPPAVYTCSISLGVPNLVASVAPGGYSDPVRQVVVNSGNAAFAGVDLTAGPWRPAVAAARADVPSASAYRVECGGASGRYAALDGGPAVAARGLEGETRRRCGSSSTWPRMAASTCEPVPRSTSTSRSAECLCRRDGRWGLNFGPPERRAPVAGWQ